jgi:hydroxymethylpyrimidine/phosphomethylpyrimidine kinase
MRVNDVESMKEAAVRPHNTGAKNVVITGGHLQGNATDVLYDGSRHQIFEAARVENMKVRGLGCTFASILAAHLARNQPLDVAIAAAKKYIAGALADSPAIGHGRGPLRHEKKV